MIDLRLTWRVCVGCSDSVEVRCKYGTESGLGQGFIDGLWGGRK